MIATLELFQLEGVIGEFEVWKEDRWITVQSLGGRIRCNRSQFR